MPNALQLGLTGGIGSGKSTVARLLGQAGATVVDADDISRQTTAANGAAIAAIAQTFGPQYINAEGALDREKMRATVYSDPLARQQLEAIIHPLVAGQVAHQTACAEASGSPCIVFDVPLLIESSHWRQKVHKILIVDCTTEVQVSRVMARNGLSHDAVESIIRAQSSRLARLQAADMVIFNDLLTLDELGIAVNAVWQRLRLSFP